MRIRQEKRCQESGTFFRFFSIHGVRGIGRGMMWRVKCIRTFSASFGANASS